MSHITGTEHQREAILKHFPPFTLILSQSLGPCQSEIPFPTQSEICLIIHISCSKGAFEHWAAKLYHTSLVAVQGHSGQQALHLLFGTPLVLHLELSSHLFSHSAQLQHCCSVLVKHSSCQKPLCSPCSKCSSFSRLTLESRGCEPASNILVKILFCLKISLGCSQINDILKLQLGSL